MNKVISLLIVLTFIFPDTIKYFELRQQGTFGNAAGLAGTTSIETIKVAENVTIKSIEANYISFSQTASKLSGSEATGIFLALGSILNLWNLNREVPTLNYNDYDDYDEFMIASAEQNDKNLKSTKLISNLASSSYLLAGISLMGSKIKKESNLIKIPCKNVIEILDEKNRLVEFNCSEN